ncbi:hypothetical protein LJB99_00335 [Deltaproteobacteria bacterium OttesenSCG-928-K17]|nr:hypothetical protein [Deltaproteobacteria bacterium OttesenSCG-928-K17]
MVVIEKMGFKGFPNIHSILQILIPAAFIFVCVLIVAAHLWGLRNGRLKDLAELIASLVLAYGMIAFSLPAIAKEFIPNTWQWPAASETKVLGLDDGRRAASHDSAVRIQVYDSSGTYLSGWYAPIETNRMHILGTGPDHGWGEDRNTIMVDAGGTLFLFDPYGRIIMEKPAPYKTIIAPKGRFETMRLKSPWYKWPLAHPLRAWLLGGIGIICFALLNVIGEKPGTGTAGKSSS